MKKFFRVLLILIAFSFTSVHAASTDLFRTNDNVFVEENLAGSSFVAGNKVDVKADINGILFAAGNNATVSGKSDYAFIAGNIIKIDNASFKDGFIAGSDISISNSTIERDLYVAGNIISITNNIGRSAYIAGSDITIDGVINGDLHVEGNNITINSNTIINGRLSYNEDATITFSKDAKILGETTKIKSNNNFESKFKVATIGSKLLDALTSFLNILVVGLISILLFPSLFKKIKEIENKKLLSAFGFGLLTLIVCPIAAVFVMITIAGLSLGLISLVLYFIAIYVSTIFSTYKLSSLVFGNKIKNDYLLMIVGLLIVSLIKLIPILGGLCSFILLCLGLGIIITQIFKRK